MGVARGGAQVLLRKRKSRAVVVVLRRPRSFRYRFSMSRSAEDLSKILGENEERLSSWCRSDPVALSKKLLEKYILSDSLLDRSKKYKFFESLDHSRVDPQLQVRYLLRLVSERVSEDENVWKNFRALLKKEEEEMHDYLSELTSDGDTEIWYDCQSEFSSVDSSSLCTPLSSEDIPWIFDVLKERRHKWEQLAIPLGLTAAEIEDCRRNDNFISLNNVLNYWLAKRIGTSLRFTMTTLLSALRSISEKSVAEKLRDQCIKKKKGNSTHKTEGINASLSLTHQSYDVKVADGKSTLLHVQASPRQSVCYQWKKDGQSLANSCTYYGVNEDILVVSHASQGTEGEYTCCVSCGGSEKCSNKITLTVLYPPAKKKFLDLYSTQKEEVPLDSWPPVGTKSFINLSIVESFNEESYIDFDEDNSHQIKKEYSDIFEHYKSRSLIVVKGHPGSGKTTLVKKILKDWCKGLALRKGKLVLLLTLRDINSETTQKTLSSTIKSLLVCSEEDAKIICKEIEATNGEGVCFLIDGLDEYHAREKSFIHQLLEKKYLPLSMVILTSRPVALDNIKENVVTCKVQVLGFSKQQIFEYIDSFPFASSSYDSHVVTTYPTKLKKYLHSHPNVFHMCYLPVHAAMVCYLFRCHKGNIPNSQTKIYEQFVCSIILRHLKRHDSEARVPSLKELSGRPKDHFDKLCHLAYNMTISGKQVATLDVVDEELCEYVKNKSNEWCLGLVTIDHIAELSGITDKYSFLHLTIQEFLTAYYLTGLKDKGQKEILSCHSVISLPLFRFYCGLSPSQYSSDIKKITRRLSGTFNIEESIVLCIGAFESQQTEFCYTAGKHCSGCYDNYSSVTPSDLYAMSYVILNTFYPVKEIILTSLYGDYDYTHFFECINSKKFSDLEKLDLRIGLRYDEIVAVAGVLRTSINLNNVNLEFHEINCDSAATFTTNLQYITNLKFLSITCNSYMNNGIKTLLSGLSHLKSTQISLDFINLDYDGVLEVDCGLYHLSNVYHLQLTECNISDEGLKVLTAPLHSSIVELILSNNNITTNGVLTIIIQVHCLTSLELLDLSNNSFGSENAIALANQLPQLTHLKTLFLSHIDLGSSGAISLAKQLHLLTSLSCLDLSFNEIDLKSAISVITSLTKSPISSLYLNNSTALSTMEGIHVDGLVSSENESAVTNLKAAIQGLTKNLSTHGI